MMTIPRKTLQGLVLNNGNDPHQYVWYEFRVRIYIAK